MEKIVLALDMENDLILEIENKVMPRIEFQIDIQAPIEKVYEISQNYSVRYEWDPFPDSITLLNGATDIAKGVCVSVIAKNGLKMEVEFVQVKSPTTAAIIMRNGPAVLKAFSGSWVFKAISSTETSARFVYAITTAWWSAPFVSGPIAAWYFRNVIEARLLGLKKYCEEPS